MNAEHGSKTPSDRAKVLQQHLCDRAATLALPAEPRALFDELRKHLLRACDENVLATKPQGILAWLKLSDSPLGARPEYTGIYGGEKDLKRTGSLPRFLRRDGAWFTFTITVRARKAKPLELAAYDFELCFPERNEAEARLPRFVRFDLNRPEHDNQIRGLRCHMHPGHDDLIAPAPLMSPLEILDLFLNSELSLPDRARRA